jgi:site-specific recombinase XerD
MNTEKPLNRLITDYVEQLDCKEYVQKNTLWVLQRFVKWMTINRVNISEPRRADIIHYKNTITSEGKTPTTLNRYMSPVRGFFRYLEKENIYSDIAVGIKTPDDQRRVRKEYLKPEQIIQLLESIPTTTVTGLRDYAMINLMVCLGLRRVEILRLTVADLCTESNGYSLNVWRKGKNYKEKIKIESELFEPIENYLLKRESFSDSSALFGNHGPHSKQSINLDTLSLIVKKYLKLINDSKKLTCHSLRHSAAINLLNSGSSIYDVKDMLGHSTTKSTEIYLKAIEAERRFNSPAVNQLIAVD